MEQVQATGTGDTNTAILVAIELSKATWLLAMCDPVMGKVSRRRVDGGDAGALIELLERHRRDAQARTVRSSRSSASSRPAMTGFGCTAAWLRLGSPAA